MIAIVAHAVQVVKRAGSSISNIKPSHHYQAILGLAGLENSKFTLFVYTLVLYQSASLLFLHYTMACYIKQDLSAPSSHLKEQRPPFPFSVEVGFDRDVIGQEVNVFLHPTKAIVVAIDVVGK